MRKYQYKREPLTSFEKQQLENACKTQKEKLVIWTLLDTGLRVEEFCSIQQKDVDWSNHRILVDGKNTKGANEKGEYKRKLRSVPIPPRIQKTFEQWIADNGGINIAVRTAQSIVKKVGHRVSLGKVSPHVLRHTFAVVWLKDKGGSLPALSQLLGHEDLETTKIYLNMSNAEAIREYEEKW